MKTLLAVAWLALLALPAAAGLARTAPDTGKQAGQPRLRRSKLLMSTLLESLKDKDEAIRAKAAEDIGRMEPPAVEAVGALIDSLKDPAPVVRYRVVETLEHIGTPTARKAVLKFRKKLSWDKKSW